MLEHIHVNSVICRMNITLFYPDMPTAESDRLDALELERARAAAKEGRDPREADEPNVFASGPLQRLVIPQGHSRRGVGGAWAETLACQRSSFEMSFEDAWAYFDAQEFENMCDELPIELANVRTYNPWAMADAPHDA